MTPNMFVASFAWLALLLGFVFRRKRLLHVVLMHTGILLDIALVVYLQIARNALQTAMSFSLSLLEQLHILFSLAAFSLYFPVLYFGWKLFRGDETVRTLHRTLAVLALMCRTLGFVLMFSMLGG